MGKQTQSIEILTIKNKPTAEIDLSRLNKVDLISLSRTDPFMFHSIPAVNKAKLTMKNIDYSTVMPLETFKTSSIVTRKSRISTECDVFMLSWDDVDDNAQRVPSGEKNSES